VKSIKRVADFLNKDITDKEVKLIAGHCSFDSMKNNEQVNYADRPTLYFFDM
jgi:predicted glycosyltransferase